MHYYFNANNVQDNRAEYIPTFLKGHAATWWRNLDEDNNIPITWNDIGRLMMDVFKPVNALMLARNKIRNLKQFTSVEAYNQRFRELCIDITDMEEAEELDKYLAGLKPTIRMELVLKGISTITEAMRLAHQINVIKFGQLGKQSSSGQRPGQRDQFLNAHSNYNSYNTGSNYNNYYSTNNNNQQGQRSNNTNMNSHWRSAAPTNRNAPRQNIQRMQGITSNNNNNNNNNTNTNRNFNNRCRPNPEKKDRDACYNCGRNGYIARNCPVKKTRVNKIEEIRDDEEYDEEDEELVDTINVVIIYEARDNQGIWKKIKEIWPMDDIEEEEPMDIDDLLYVTDSTNIMDSTFITNTNNTVNTMTYLDDIVFTSTTKQEEHQVIDLTSPNPTFIDLISPQPIYLDLRSPSPPIVDEYAIFQQEAWEEVFLQQQRTLVELQQKMDEEKAQLELQEAIEYLDFPISTTNQLLQTTPQDWQEFAQQESTSPYYSPASPTPSDSWIPQDDTDTLISNDDQDSVMFTDEEDIIADLFTPPDSPLSRLSTWSHKLFDTVQETLPRADQWFDHDTQRITVVPPAWKDQVYPNGIHPLDLPQENQDIMEQSEEIE